MNMDQLKALLEKKPKNRKEAGAAFNAIKEYVDGPHANVMEKVFLGKLLDDLSELINKKVRGFEPLVPHFGMPQRGTKKAAGYDMRAIESVYIRPGAKAKVKTGMTAYMEEDEFLDLRIRSGWADKFDLTLQNDAGVVDSDYYGKEIAFLIRNEGDKPFVVEAGERIGQGIFSKYLTTDDDEPADTERTDGFGHTGTK